MSTRSARYIRGLRLACVPALFCVALDMPLAGIPSQLRFGLDVSRSRIETTYRTLDEISDPAATIGSFTGNRSQGAGYATHSADLGSRVHVQGGLRWDGFDDRVSADTRASHTA